MLKEGRCGIWVASISEMLSSISIKPSQALPEFEPVVEYLMDPSSIPKSSSLSSEENEPIPEALNVNQPSVKKRSKEVRQKRQASRTSVRRNGWLFVYAVAATIALVVGNLQRKAPDTSFDKLALSHALLLDDTRFNDGMLLGTINDSRWNLASFDERHEMVKQLAGIGSAQGISKFLLSDESGNIMVYPSCNNSKCEHLIKEEEPENIDDYLFGEDDEASQG